MSAPELAPSPVKNRVHPVDELLPVPKLALYGFQHLVAFSAGAVLVPIIIAGAINLPQEELVIRHPARACRSSTPRRTRPASSTRYTPPRNDPTALNAVASASVRHPRPDPHPGSHHRQPHPTTTAPLTSVRHQSLPLTIRPPAANPDVAKAMPTGIDLLFGSGISIGAIAAIVLNIAFFHLGISKGPRVAGAAPLRSMR
jgi:hypothetical protein